MNGRRDGFNGIFQRLVQGKRTSPLRSVNTDTLPTDIYANEIQFVALVNVAQRKNSLG